MANIAVLGYGTIGAGAVKVLQTNHAVIAKHAGQPVNVKWILDLRDFPGDPNEDKVIHDYSIIENDDEIDVVIECMGGTEPAHTFVKKALLRGKSVATSNKELVASYGTELIEIAREKKANFLFEASVGGGIPIIRPILTCLSAEEIEDISGILNGTTNYMLTRMEEAACSFETALREAQDKGYAELHPEADIEGHDACRKIAILTSLAIGQQVDYEDIPTEGITNITADDIRYAKIMGKRIKLLGSSRIRGDKVYAMVAPFLLDDTHPLAGVGDVFNAIFVHGNMVDDTMYYGRGAGALPTASAVVADVIDCVKHMGKNIWIHWEADKKELSGWDDVSRRFFVRVDASVSKADIQDAFGKVDMITLGGLTEKAFVTEEMTEAAYARGAKKIGHIINMIRLDG